MRYIEKRYEEQRYKVAVITGGGHGIGKAIADLFRNDGLTVHIIDINPGASVITMKEIRAFIDKHEGWIEKQLQKIAETPKEDILTLSDSYRDLLCGCSRAELQNFIPESGSFD